jgi:O-acetylhomoserine (thiol)-lyase
MSLTFMTVPAGVQQRAVTRGCGPSTSANIAHNLCQTNAGITIMAGYSSPHFDTLALHAGAAPDPSTGARAVPLHLSTSFVFQDAEHAASLFNMERPGHVYSRISNPTTAVFEERMAALDGGVGAVATASGQAALHLAVATLAGAGSHIVASGALYGGSHNLLAYTLRRFGIDTTFVPPRDLDAWRQAIRPNTRLLFGETLGNPGLDVLDIPSVSALAHEAGLPPSPRRG